jgi:hypothetical protein
MESSMTTQETEGKQITLGGIIGWGLGALMFLSGVIAIFDGGTVAGLSFLIGAFFLLPPFRDAFHKKTGKRISGPARFVIVVGLLMMAGANLPAKYSASSSSEADGVYVENYSLDTLSGVIRGTVKNDTPQSYKYVQVEFNIYDVSGNQIGSTLANVNNLEPGASWKFKAMVLEGAADRAELKGITKF